MPNASAFPVPQTTPDLATHVWRRQPAGPLSDIWTSEPPDEREEPHVTLDRFASVWSALRAALQREDAR
jgi:hypothetical protein